MIFTKELLFIFIAILVVCSIGFKKYVWFISLGYGFSIFIVGVMLLVLFFDELDFFKVLSCIILIAYGLRLSGFLALRELRSSSYNSKMKGEISDGSHMGIPVKIMLWVTCGLLYLLMTSPVIYRFINKDSYDTMFIIGLLLAVVGILIEAISDIQKSNSKKKNPNRFCDSGLFQFVRCPNYFGEMIIWTGIFLSGITSLQGIGQWIFAIIGYVGIIYVMFSGARRLEIRQDKNYGELEEYQKYIKSTPILIPFIPLYSVKKYKWLVG